MERGRNERNLPLLDRTKFLVPDELSLAQFTVIIRWGDESTGEHPHVLFSSPASKTGCVEFKY